MNILNHIIKNIFHLKEKQKKLLIKKEIKKDPNCIKELKKTLIKDPTIKQKKLYQNH